MMVIYEFIKAIKNDEWEDELQRYKNKNGSDL